MYIPCFTNIPCVATGQKVLGSEKPSTLYFYQLMEKPLGCYFQVRSPYCQVALCNQKTTIHVSLRRQVTSEKSKKRQVSTLTTASTSVCLPEPVSTNLTIKLDSILTNPIGKDGVWKLLKFSNNYVKTTSLSCETIWLCFEFSSRSNDWPGLTNSPLSVDILTV